MQDGAFVRRHASLDDAIVPGKLLARSSCTLDTSEVRSLNPIFDQSCPTRGTMDCLL